MNALPDDLPPPATPAPPRKTKAQATPPRETPTPTTPHNRNLLWLLNYFPYKSIKSIALSVATYYRL